MHTLRSGRFVEIQSLRGLRIPVSGDGNPFSYDDSVITEAAKWGQRFV